jgi:trehalose 6-phosphate synthase
LARLVVVSNRVPAPHVKSAAGGLAVALESALRDSGGLWFGWSGETVDGPVAPTQLRQDGGITYATVDINADDFRAFYRHYANQTLWPLFHHRIDLASFDHGDYAGYHRVNRLFAERLAPLLRDDDVVWVHDYHLIPLGAELRRSGCKLRIGFFLHIPFPAAEILTVLYNHAPLIRALLCYDLIGFQAARDLRLFRDYVAHELPFATLRDDGTIAVPGHVTRADVFPIGIDTDQFAALATTPEALKHGRRLRATLGNCDVMLSVDRLDYTKGLPEKLKALGCFFEMHPQRRRQTAFVQIAAPSRAEVPQYKALKEQAEAVVGRINARYAEFDWTPVRFVSRTYSQTVLAGLYRQARVAVVTPLRDGMNLVSMEYVASQNESDPGVLVLSRFAGSASILDGAIEVNPYDAEDIADAMELALGIPLEERTRRWTSMMASLRRHSLTAWRTNFLAALECGPEPPAPGLVPSAEVVREELAPT